MLPQFEEGSAVVIVDLTLPLAVFIDPADAPLFPVPDRLAHA
jgi:hypothetical protein